MKAIEFEGVSQTYRSLDGKDTVALQDVTLSVEPGEFVSIVGPSGCGKTTLLRLVAGLMPVQSGSVRMTGSAVTAPRPDVGVVFQQAMLLPWLRVSSNVLLPIDVQGRERSRYLKRAADLIHMVGLGGFEDRLPRELSGGMQQRVALARALVHEPSVLLMDEPFAALDAITREAMNIELQRIWSYDQKTVLFITHSIPEAIFLADRVVIMTPRPGRIAKILDIPFRRPRSLSDLASPEFGQLTAVVRAALHPEAEVEAETRLQICA